MGSGSGGGGSTSGGGGGGGVTSGGGGGGGGGGGAVPSPPKNSNIVWDSCLFQDSYGEVPNDFPEIFLRNFLLLDNFSFLR